MLYDNNKIKYTDLEKSSLYEMIEICGSHFWKLERGGKIEEGVDGVKVWWYAYSSLREEIKVDGETPEEAVKNLIYKLRSRYY